MRFARIFARAGVTVGVLAALFSSAVGTSHASDDPQSEQRVTIRPHQAGIQSLSLVLNVGTNRCLAVQGAANFNGSPVFQFDCHSEYYDQLWYAEPAGGGAWNFVNYATGRCLAIDAGNDTNGSQAFQYDCGYAGQTWNIYDYWIGNVYQYSLIESTLPSHRCLAIEGAANFNGSRAFQFDCHWEYADQLWRL